MWLVAVVGRCFVGFQEVSSGTCRNVLIFEGIPVRPVSGWSLASVMLEEAGSYRR